MIKFRKYIYVTFRFKSGNSINFKCNDITINKTDTIQSYEVEGIDEGDVFYCDINEIESITYKKRYGFRKA